jgi:hypothetical protein
MREHVRPKSLKPATNRRSVKHHGGLCKHSYMIYRRVGHQGRSDDHSDGVTTELLQYEPYVENQEERRADLSPG